MQKKNQRRRARKKGNKYVNSNMRKRSYLNGYSYPNMFDSDKVTYVVMAETMIDTMIGVIKERIRKILTDSNDTR